MKHTLATPVNPSGPPIFCVLRAGPGPTCVFDFANKPLAEVFAIELIGAGWEVERIDDHLFLTAPANTNVVSFPLLHPLLRDAVEIVP